MKHNFWRSLKHPNEEMAKPQKIVGINPKLSFHDNARILLPQKVAEVYSWEQFIRDPETREASNSEILHNMRISVKRLRYTMEFFSVNYDTPRKYEKWTEYIDIIIELQDILGDIHDNDVVLETLTAYKNSYQSTDMLGIETLITRTRETRHAEYESFLKRWEQLTTTGFKQKLLDIIAS